MTTPLAPDLGLPRIIVTGSRHWYARKAVYQILDDTRLEIGPFILVNGRCLTGLDHIAKNWADATRTPEEGHPADWDTCAPSCPPSIHHRIPRRPDDRVHPGTLPTYCPYAGPHRNAAMVAFGALRCLAWPLGRSRGTRNCMRLARAAGIPTLDCTLPSPDQAA